MKKLMAVLILLGSSASFGGNMIVPEGNQVSDKYVAPTPMQFCEYYGASKETCQKIVSENSLITTQDLVNVYANTGNRQITEANKEAVNKELGFLSLNVLQRAHQKASPFNKYYNNNRTGIRY